MVDNPAPLAAQPPDHQRPYDSAAVDDLSFPAADDFKHTTAYRAYAHFVASYVKFPASSSSNRYCAMTIMHTYTPMVRIIFGFLWTGNTGGSRALQDGGNRKVSRAGQAQCLLTKTSFQSP
jgi:hypothetical protein